MENNDCGPNVAFVSNLVFFDYLNTKAARPQNTWRRVRSFLPNRPRQFKLSRRSPSPLFSDKNNPQSEHFQTTPVSCYNEGKRALSDSKGEEPFCTMLATAISFAFVCGKNIDALIETAVVDEAVECPRRRRLARCANYLSGERKGRMGEINARRTPLGEEVF